MRGHVGAVVRSPRVRAVFSYPFRLGPPEEKWSSTPFGGLAIVHNLSSAGDALVTVALAGSVFVSVSLNAARDRTALGLLCTVLPFAVVGPFVGPAIDRVRGGRKFIVFMAAIGRMAACLMMAAWIHSLLLFPAAFLSLVCSKTHAIAKAALVPGVVDQEQELVRANARLAVGASVYTSVAAAVGSLIYRLLGSHALLDTDVLVFGAVAGLSLYLLSGAKEPVGPLDPGAGIHESEGPPQRSRHLWGGLVAGLAPGPRPAVPRDVVLAQITMAGMRAVAGFMTALVIFAFRKEGAPVIWYGLVAVASVGGNFGGALSAPRLRQRFSEKTLVASAAALIAATAVAVTQFGGLHRRPAALILALVVGLGASVAKTAFDAIVQAETHDFDRSRLFARFESIFQLAWVVGAVVPTLFYTPLLVGFIVVAVIVIACSTSFVFGVAKGRSVSTPAPAGVISQPPVSLPDRAQSPDATGWGLAPEPYTNPGAPPAR